MISTLSPPNLVTKVQWKIRTNVLKLLFLFFDEIQNVYEESLFLLSAETDSLAGSVYYSIKLARASTDVGEHTKTRRHAGTRPLLAGLLPSSENKQLQKAPDLLEPHAESS